MEMSGEQFIAAPKDRVWSALNDPEVLRQCIPGCQSLERIADDRMKAVAGIRVGPIGARFSGEVLLSELDPPNSYRITGEGQGGAAGFAKGGAAVQLNDKDDGTLLSYAVDVMVGGRLAQLGGPLIDATAKQMAGTFFRKFSEIVAREEPLAVAATSGTAGSSADAVTPVRSPHAASQPVPASTGVPVAWILAVAVAALAGVLIGGGGAVEGASAWQGLAIALLLIVVAFAAFEYGRRSAAQTIRLDDGTLARLAELLGKTSA